MLAVDELTKRFGATLAVDQLSFRASPARVLGFLGPNGAGKTTTLRMLLGLTLPTSGTATVEGRPYRELRDAIEVVGAVLEGPQFHPGQDRAQSPPGPGHGRRPACGQGRRGAAAGRARRRR
jgi:ABC-2 type transport system ATP-binding protein